MTWMLDAHAGQILRGLYKEHDRDRWKTWLGYGSVVLFAGIASGGAFVKLRPPSAPIAPVATEIAVKPGTTTTFPSPVATEIAVKPGTTTTFPSLLSADLPQLGWRNPEVEKMRRLLKPRPRAAKPGAVHPQRLAVRH